MSKNILLWSPFLGEIGTRKAVENYAHSLARYSNNKIFLINVLGEFNDFNHQSIHKVNFLNNIYNILPHTGLLSKISIYFFSLMSIPYLFYQIKKLDIEIIISFLSGIFPLFVKLFHKKIFFVMSIQGFPKLNFLRTLLWKKLYSKAELIITMSDLTKKIIHEKVNLKNIIKINNPIINRNIKLVSKHKLDFNEELLFKKQVICGIGRLTKQKNFLQLIKAFQNSDDNIKINSNLILLGEGEEKGLLKRYIDENHLKNVFLLGHQKNPYKILSRSKLFISSSLWEDPGHAILEAAYLNIPIITSNCMSGPREIFINNFNCLNYEVNNQDDLTRKINYFFKIDKKSLYKIKLNSKRTTKDFTNFRFYKELQKKLN